jgi:N utilization substance protein A
VKRLFETTIPEVASGVIEVMAVARDAGYRSKVGVKSNNPDVDPKGSCVGQQGSRVKQINYALNGERIDIFVWSDDPIQLIAEALTPATVLSVLPDPEERKATVIVPDSQFSLAIGKGGQNARLASQATGWKIDIKDESTAFQEGIKFKINVLNK